MYKLGQAVYYKNKMEAKADNFFSALWSTAEELAVMGVAFSPCLLLGSLSMEVGMSFSQFRKMQLHQHSIAVKDFVYDFAFELSPTVPVPCLQRCKLASAQCCSKSCLWRWTESLPCDLPSWHVECCAQHVLKRTGVVLEQGGFASSGFRHWNCLG